MFIAILPSLRAQLISHVIRFNKQFFSPFPPPSLPSFLPSCLPPLSLLLPLLLLQFLEFARKILTFDFFPFLPFPPETPLPKSHENVIHVRGIGWTDGQWTDRSTVSVRCIPSNLFQIYSDDARIGGDSTGTGGNHLCVELTYYKSGG